jgi:RNA polymerase sigma factor (sigma-70 family)
MTTASITETTPDFDLWTLVLGGSVPAFEILVRRHQAAVSAVAYNACGDLALSEDVAQETFWTAWRERTALAEPGRLRAWLCGIARNLGRNSRRRAARAPAPAAPDAVAALATATPGPAEQAVAREEEVLLWQTLEQMPETYREPLILFYREQQSVTDVAEALDLSEDAVKQRLARGRGMLRDRVAELVEGTLRRTRPGKAFTVAVVAGVTSLSVGAKTAFAGTGAGVAGPALKAAAGTGLAGGLLGSILGPIGGLLGGWFGTWLPAELAPTKPERDYLRRVGRRMLLVSLLFMVALVVGIWALAGRAPFQYYLISFFAWFVAYGVYVTIETIRTVRETRRIRADPALAEPNAAPLRAGFEAVTRRYRGRVFRSRASLFGLPLVDINVGDPSARGGPGRPRERRVARGWIAIGDDARGILLAIGSRAVGLVAIGGIAVGGLSFGGMAVGLVAVGGLAAGGLALGGLGIGGIAFGGMALGWQACGGGAIAWDVACGGGAVAWHAAYGGGAIAHDYAVGGAAQAAHANDRAAEAVLLNHPLQHAVGWYTANTGWVTGAIVVLSVLLPCVLLLLMYRRESAGEDTGTPGASG